MKQLYEKYSDRISFEVMSGGMIMGLRAGVISEVAPYIKKAYPDVERATGIRFGEAFLQNILLPGTAIISSEMPGIAMTVFKQYLPEKAVLFAHALQNMLYAEGIELNSPENYREAVASFGLPVAEFLDKMGMEENRYETLLEFQTVSNWQVNGFPTVLLKPVHEEQYYMIARGYTELARIEEIIGKILPEKSEE
jgi:putative protein-disulfide isomerase